MSAPDQPGMTRRGVVAAGAVTVSFAIAPQGWGEAAPTLPGALNATPQLDAWIRIDSTGAVTVFTGKAELGQGVRTALTQVAAEELDLPPAAVRLITADTGRTPNEGLTAGSNSMKDSGTAILNAAANVRALLTEAAAAKWGVPADAVATTGDGALRARDGRTVRYGDLAAGLSLNVRARPDAPLRRPAAYRSIGKPLPRIDIPGKLAGGQAYVHDMRLPGMLHARVVRGANDGTRLTNADVDAVAAMPGVVKVTRNGAFAAVIAERQWTAIQAMRRLQGPPANRKGAVLPPDPHRAIQTWPSQDAVIMDRNDAAGAEVRRVKSRYTRPWLLHGSIGPSCAVAQFADGVMTVWTHSQGVYPLRGALAQLLRMPVDKIRCIHTEGSGCYGHNGADDVAADAALAALAVPGRPVRLQWMREQEHGWEPMGTGMTVEAEAGLDASGHIVDWRYEVWSNTHNNRPNSAGGLLAGLEVDPPFPAQIPRPAAQPEGAGDRNAVPLYAIPRGRVVSHFLQDSPVRVSALRSLGAQMNVFGIESFMDELAKAANADPVAFRLAHLQDPRARDAIDLCAEKFGWARRARGDGRRGSGFAFARYKNLAAYCAVALEIEVGRDSGAVAVRRAVAAVDAGQAVNPDGIRNQIEGAIVQSLSWSLIESVGFDAGGRTSANWASYPIARFADVPGSVEVHVIDRPGERFLGAGEAGQGPASAALANAVADTIGVRLRDLPLNPARIKEAIRA